MQIAMKRSKRKKYEKDEAGYQRLLVVTILIFLNVVPFFVYSHVELLPELAQEYFANKEGYTADFFLYWKEMLLSAFAVWLVLFFIGERIYPEHPIKNIPLRNKNAKITLRAAGVYVGCLFVSTILSKEKRTALVGCCTEYEGMLALLAYVVLFLAGYNYFQKKRDRELLKYGLTILMSVIAVLALVESFYQPIYEIDFMKYLIAPAEYREMAASLSNQEYRGRVTLSFYNPAYLGGLCAMLLPICFGFAYEENRKWKRWCYLLLTASILFTLLQTGSTGAFLGAVLGMVLLCLMLRRDRRRLLAAAGRLMLLLAAGFLLMNFLSDGKAAEKVVSVVKNQDKWESTTPFPVTEIKIEGEGVRVSSREARITETIRTMAVIRPTAAMRTRPTAAVIIRITAPITIPARELQCRR